MAGVGVASEQGQESNEEHAASLSESRIHNRRARGGNLIDMRSTKTVPNAAQRLLDGTC
jgi:hypothetical protein